MDTNPIADKFEAWWKAEGREYTNLMLVVSGETTCMKLERMKICQMDAWHKGAGCMTDEMHEAIKNSVALND